MQKIICIKNLDCAACAAELQEELAQVKGITAPEVDFVTQRVRLSYETEEALKKAIEDLEPREKEIMQLRFGLNNHREYTQKEVADLLSISQSYISRLEKKILGKLRQKLEALV